MNTKDRVTIYQVAQAAGVSLATVSRVINKQGNVTDATRMKVEETIKRLGYKPSGLAQALATNKSTNIGVVIPSANYVYISNLLNGISEVAKKKGFILSLFTTSHSHEEALSMIEKVITSHVDGAIIFDDELDSEDVMKINSYSVPTVVVNSKLIGEKVGCVLFNYADVLSKYIESYYEKGGDKMMTFVHVHDGGRLLNRSEKAFLETHERLGKQYNVLNCDDSYTRTYNDFCQYFKNHKGEFLIVYRDSIAAAIENAATDVGLHIPEDLEILSLVGTKYANIVRPSLTSLHINMEEVGQRAMYMLIDLINNELVEKSYKFQPTLIERSSTIKR